MAKGISLHIGLNRVDPAHYAGWSGPLQACEADAKDMAGIASVAKYVAATLLTERATRQAVIGGIENAAKTLKAGDIFFLTYSGHGGQVPDFEDEEPDLQDETWCLYDGQLIDDELRELWARFGEGTRILVLSDSCHSGTVTRLAYDALVNSRLVQRPVSSAEGNAAPVFRAMPVDAALRTYRANTEFYQNIAKTFPATPSQIRASVRLISGCQDNQLSADGAFNGLFTGTLIRVWNRGTFQGTYHQFHLDIVRRMPPTQSPNHFVIGLPSAEFDHQQPFQV